MLLSQATMEHLLQLKMYKACELLTLSVTFGKDPWAHSAVWDLSVSDI